MAPIPEDYIRPRLVLVTTPLADGDAAERLRAALSGGDVASVLIDRAGREDAAFQDLAETLVPIVQEAGAAAIVVDDSRCAGRVRADGLHLTGGDIEALAESVERYAPKLIVGGSGFETRHDALEAGEKLPDYILFGRLAADVADEPHRKDLAMAQWWATIVEIPCIVLGGRSLESLPLAIETGAEFIALSAAVFEEGADPAERVAAANAAFDADAARTAA
ncbi:thiamine phosphate synthase [Aurantimonas sp. Leaf443]|uniref:thiamine phosphate synthase n=1 Tax=Aurantimonas sp. Leaf443 TaxID=1736378 RepID=UPI0006F883AF|nr:thiamine phosphate synthase [Aurantimonas sp. Leaf443]KQT88107.1 thiamine-phosphate pyrophosphorylase [Aurantimonas sp. Leaf443]